MAKIETPRPIRGTQSMRGEEAERFQHVVDTFERVRRLYGFGRVELPVFEATAVFSRTLGETTDVVSKEMYTFPDKGGEFLTLRPEFTAGIARAYLTEGWRQYAPMKVATHGPLFRYERPQKGRFRQFHQLDAEVIGAAEPEADVELLCFADKLLRALKIEGVTLKLNTLGDGDSRERWRSALVEHFEPFRDQLSDDSQRRLDTNPLRILDSKDPQDAAAISDAPRMVLSGEAEDFFDRVRAGLDSAEIAYELAPNLVRGLDYYRHTAFEFVTDKLGAQGTVLGGGRYDGLIEQLGGPHTPAVGWAAGIERLRMMLDEGRKPLRSAAISVETDDPDLVALANSIRSALMNRDMPAEIFAEGSVRKRFDKAVATRADYIFALVEGQVHGEFGRLRVKRQVKDRYATRGNAYPALRPMLVRRFGVDHQLLKAAVFEGGEIILRPERT